MNLILPVTFLVVLDQVIKYYVKMHMTEGMSIPVINNIFHITYVLNPGAAFGLLENQRLIFIFVAVLLISIFLYNYKRIIKLPVLTKVGAVFFLSGAIGNLIDRVDIGKVVDYLDFRIWPVFNFADIIICVGAAFIIWELLMTSEAKN